MCTNTYRKHLHVHWRMNCIVLVAKRNRIECFVFIEEIITHSAYFVACYDEARNVIPSSYKYTHLCADRVYTQYTQRYNAPSLVCICAHGSLSLCRTRIQSAFFSLAATLVHILTFFLDCVLRSIYTSLSHSRALLHSLARV